MDPVSSSAAAGSLQYQCDFLDAGTTDWEIWISTAFRSPHDPQDALHLVCGFHDEEDAAIEGLYLERKDQAQGGTGLLEEAVLHADRLCLRLTARGVTVLGFACDRIELLFPPDPERVAKVVEQAQAMREEPNGQQMRLA